jgi:hypothetical protein
MVRSLFRLAAIVWAACIAAAAFGDTIIVPNGNATVKGNDTSGPLGDIPSSFRSQSVINPDQLPAGPIMITGFAYRATPGKGTLNLSVTANIYLSTSRTWANSTGHPLMSTTFANNVGADNTLVMSPTNLPMTGPGCAGPAPCPFGTPFVFTTPFPYDRANGPLLIDIQVTGFSASGSGEFDVVAGPNATGVTNNVDAFPVGSATGELEASDNVTQITYTPVTINLNQHGVTGSWYQASTSGQGIEVEVFPNLSAAGTGVAQVSWFTFDNVVGGADHQRWYTLGGSVPSGQPASLTIYQNVGGNFNAPPVTAGQAVGTATLSLDTCTSGVLSYTFTDGSNRTGSIPVTRLTQNVTCSPAGASTTNSDFALSGNWYDAATSGQGITVEVNPTSRALFLAWYTYSPSGANAGAAGQRWYTGLADFAAGTRSIPVQLYETTGGMFNATTNPPPQSVVVGSGTLSFHTCSSATLTYNFTGGTSTGKSGAVTLTRVGPVPAGCTS